MKRKMHSESVLPPLRFKDKKKKGDQFSTAQRDAIHRAVEKRECLFLTGSGGVGKSYVVREIISRLQEKKVTVNVTASTGIAGTHLQGGITLHSFLGVGLAKDPIRVLLAKLKYRKAAKDRIQKVETLVIDEVSMLDPYLFEILEQLSQELRRNTLPFGGIQVIVIGDFLQLPVVRTKDSTPYTYKSQVIEYGFQHPLWQRSFGKENTIYLTEIFRQEDLEVCNRLNSMRDGTMTVEDHKFWQSQVRTVPNAVEKNLIYLFSRNKEAEAMNTRRLNEICRETGQTPRTFKSKERCDGSDAAKQWLGNMKKNCLAVPELKLAIGARFMLLWNLSFEEKLINGSRGTVVAWDEKTGYPVVEWLPECGKEEKSRRTTVHPHRWIFDSPRSKTWYEQIPLRLASAITIHKSQGMTLDGYVVTTKDIHECGQLYIALSRMKSLSGLYLLDYNPAAVKVRALVAEFDRSMRPQLQLQ